MNGTTLDKGRERIGVTLFPTEDTVRDFCVMEKLRNPFYEELMQRLSVASSLRLIVFQERAGAGGDCEDRGC